MARRLARTAVGVATFATLLLAVATSYAQDATATLSGSVKNVTPGGTLPPDMAVQLHIIANGTEVETLAAPVGPDGSFTFQSVPVVSDRAYVLVAAHQGVFYSTEFDLSQEKGPINLTVHDATADNARLAMRTSVVFMAAVDGKERLASFLEIHTIENSGDRTFVPNLETAGMPSLLRFSLPARFQDLEVQSPLPGGQLLEVDQGFAVSMPVPPGQHEFMFSYRVPYDGSAMAFDRAFPFFTGTFRLLIPETAGTASVAGIRRGAVTSIGGASQQVFEGENLDRGATITIELAGLPQPSLTERVNDAFQGQMVGVGVAGIAGIALAGLLVYAVRIRGKRRGVPAVPPVVAGTGVADEGPVAVAVGPAQGLVAQMAALDDLFATGRLAQADYEAQRASLKAQLVELRIREGGA